MRLALTFYLAISLKKWIDEFISDTFMQRKPHGMDLKWAQYFFPLISCKSSLLLIYLNTFSNAVWPQNWIKLSMLRKKIMPMHKNKTTITINLIKPWLLIERNVGNAYGAKNSNICSSYVQEYIHTCMMFNVSTSIILVIDVDIFIE